ncbi:MAG: AAA family ATPase [Deltaproteobacteria bacterium]|nr:AAA family ATPase [Deltaproteobacteria bacterium]
MPFNTLIDHRRVIVCVGAGGVGKTTVAASIGLRAAMEGRRALVLTIDPARRLANALGLSELGNQRSTIELPKRAKGALYGMMLDQKRAFDELVHRIAPNADAEKRILDNHYYQQLSTALAGSHEYMAMEKLHEVWETNDYDLIVLDTPPTKHALDFLDAPKRMTEFLDAKVVQWFLHPYMKAGRIGFKFAQKSAAAIFRLLEKGTGYQALADLAEFFLAFDGLYEGFKRRAERVHRLLGDVETAFVLVTTPRHPAVDEAAFFRDRLRETRMPLASVVFNRVHEPIWPGAAGAEAPDPAKIARGLGDDSGAVASLLSLGADLDTMARNE